MSFENELRQAMAAGAASVDPLEHHPYERVTAAVARNRRSRRITGLVALAIAAVLAISVPVALNRLGQDSTLPANRSSLPVASDPLWDQISTWPLRGSLAGDEELVAQVGERFGGRPVLLADLGQRRFAVVVTGSRLLFAVGQRGDPAQRLVDTNPDQLGSANSGAIVVVGGGQQLIATTPDVKSVEVSRNPVIGLDGKVTKQWERLPLTDGMGVGPRAELTQLRVGTYDDEARQTFSTGEGDPPADNVVCHAPCSDEELAELQVSELNKQAATIFGLSPDDVTTQTTWLGTIPMDIARQSLSPGLIGYHAMMHVAVTTLPGGQTLRSVWALPIHPTRGSTGASGGHEDLLRPIAVDQVSVMPVLHYAHHSGPGGPPVSLWVVSPGGSAVRAVSKDENRWPSSPAVPLTSGSARLDLRVSSEIFEAQYTLRVLDSRGAVLGTFPPTGANPLFD